MMRRCCTCSGTNGGRCIACKCVAQGLKCINCPLAMTGNCGNPNGSEVRSKPGSVVCPFPGCSDGRGGRAVVMIVSTLDKMRAHINSHLSESKFDIPASWLLSNHSCWCRCGFWITSLQLSCSTCRGAHSEIIHRRTPKADCLPPPPGHKPDISIRLCDPDPLPVPAEAVREFKSVEGKEIRFIDSLMELCRVNAPLIKQLPKSAVAVFAKTWAGLFMEATSTHSVASWRGVFLFPKAVLLAPVRGGRRISRRSSL